MIDKKPKIKRSVKPPGNSPAHPELLEREFSDAVVFFHEALASRLSIGSAEWKCLGLLQQHGPLTSSRLANLSGFTTGAITGIVDRLERTDYVRREPHPSDRRSSIVKLVSPGELRERVSPVFQSLRQSMEEVRRRYSPSQLAAISSFLKEATEVLHRETLKLKRSKPRANSSE
jgi:DNA-binding MarR family transcriptional regulator